MTRALSGLSFVLLALLAIPRIAYAGGYDTPILYSARHIGMAGTAISYVSDPSALFHNPAGLANIDKASILANVSPAFGSIKGTPGPNLESETTFAPFFLVGGAYRVADWATIGLAVYPVASAGGEYKYGTPTTTNSTTLMFIEASPGIGFNLPYGITLGAGYRVTYASLERYQGDGGAMGPFLDFKLTGLNFLGFRAGAQWQHALSEEGNQRIRLGALYRHKTETNLESDDGTALFQDFTDISMKFVLPSRFGFGGRYDVYDAGVSVDAEYALNSQNEGYPLKGKDASGTDRAVGNYFRWSDSWTVRTGLEYRLLESRLPIRVGYIWDQKTTNERFPTAFGTPPGPSHIQTVGCGWIGGKWQVNVAYAHRRAKGEVTPADIAAGTAELDAEGKTGGCQFCGGPGEYDLTLHGIYLDASYDF